MIALGLRDVFAVAIDSSATTFSSIVVAVTRLAFKAAARSNCHIPSAKKTTARITTPTPEAIRGARELLLVCVMASIYAHKALIETAHQENYGDNQKCNSD